jgi:capsular exopolysaccharide synthesis family protein
LHVLTIGKKGVDPVDTDQNELDLKGVLGVIRRRAFLVALCAVLTAAVAFAVCSRQTKKYTATASLVFNNNQQAEQVAGLQAVSVSNQQAQQSTNVKLVKLGDMAEKTARRLGDGLTEKKVREDIAVEAQGESDIVGVAATETSPALAVAVANVYTDQFVTEQQGSDHAYYASALALVNKQLAAMSPRQRLSPAGLALQGRAQSLGVLAELKNGSVHVAQLASPPSGPSSPQTSRNTALGGVLGLVLGLGLAFLAERMDRRVREPEDLEQAYGLPLLGVVPESKALRRNGDPRAALPSGEAEAFHLIRAHLRYFNVDRQLHTLLVASAGPGDGKTTIARHLAAAAARMGSRTLLMEADLRRPTLARQLGISPGRGLADVLIGAVSLSGAIQTIPLQAGEDGRTLDVLTAGAVLPPNPGELLESHAMESVLASARSLYDMVIVDTPPLTAVSDAFPLLHKIDGMIVVGRLGRNRRDVAKRLRETLAGAGAPLLGVIANGLKSGDREAYGYGYEYASPPRQGSLAASPSNGLPAPQPGGVDGRAQPLGVDGRPQPTGVDG